MRRGGRREGEGKGSDMRGAGERVGRETERWRETHRRMGRDRQTDRE